MTDVASKQHPIIIFCSTNNYYALPLTVALKSLEVNHRGESEVNINILYDILSNSSKTRIQNSISSKRIHVNFIRVDTQPIKELPTKKYFSRESYFRLLIPNVVGDEVKKAIYLDCDILVRNDIEQLWNISTSGHHILGVQEHSVMDAIKNYRDFGLCGQSPFFNTGILVIDIHKFRQDNVTEKVIKFRKQNDSYSMDQQSLNIVLSGKFGELNPRWNVFSHVIMNRDRDINRFYRKYSRRFPVAFDRYPFKGQADMIFRDPFIVHFTTRYKPWNINVKTPFQSEFYDYMKKTAWNNLDRVRREFENILRQKLKRFLKFR